jgi:hypothetical protein
MPGSEIEASASPAPIISKANGRLFTGYYRDQTLMMAIGEMTVERCSLPDDTQHPTKQATHVRR